MELYTRINHSIQIFLMTFGFLAYLWVIGVFLSTVLVFLTGGTDVIRANVAEYKARAKPGVLTAPQVPRPNLQKDGTVIYEEVPAVHIGNTS
jgi:hypothetical protein